MVFPEIGVVQEGGGSGFEDAREFGGVACEYVGFHVHERVEGEGEIDGAIGKGRQSESIVGREFEGGRVAEAFAAIRDAFGGEVHGDH